MENNFNDIIRLARAESYNSGLSGSTEGPRDAYRHMLWMAETARQIMCLLTHPLVKKAL